MRDILFLLFATFMWGLWGFAEKRAVELAHPLTVQWMYVSIYTLLLPALFFAARRVAPLSTVNWAAYGWAAAAAVLALIAVLAFLMGLQNVDASIAVAITAAYPLITLLATALSRAEVITPQKVVGILIVMVGVYVLSR